MTARLGTCHDLTKNDADLKKIGQFVSTFLNEASPAALIFPWFPSPSRVKITATNIKLFLMLRNYVEARRQAEPTNDAIDVLIADGETTQYIVQVSFAPKGAR